MNKAEVIAKIREIKPLLESRYSVKRIGLFGSFANDTSSPESDIDLLVELESPIGWKFFTMEIYLEEVLGRKIDLVTKNALKAQLKEDILTKTYYIE